MSTRITQQTNSVLSTKKLGEKSAEQIIKTPAKAGAVVLALRGELGAGKTTFLQGFAKGLGIKEKITSPTFVIFRNYKLKTTNYKLFYHLDCYRLENPEDILELGFQEIISNPANIVAIEWPEKIKSVLPKDILEIEFQWIDKNKRKITFPSSF